MKYETMIYITKIHKSISKIPIFSSNLLSRLNFSPNYHHLPSDKNPNFHHPNLLNHKDWLSQPEVIRIFQNLKDPNFTLKLFDQLSNRKDYKPNESLYITIVNKLANAKNFDGIETLMEKIKLERKCRLSDEFFRSVIKVYGHSSGRINKSIETLFDMPNYKCWPSTKTFNSVLNLLVSTKQFEVIPEVYSRAHELGIEIDSCCLNIIVKGLCERGEMEAAFKVLDEFPQQKCKPNARTYSTIMHGLCSLGRISDAFDLLERMESEGIEADAVVFNILILGLRKEGRFDEGIAFFDRGVVKGCEANPGTYQEVLYCLLDAKRFIDAKKFMVDMVEKGINPSFESFKMVINGFCRENVGGDVEWALREMAGCGFAPKMGMWKEMVRCVLCNGGGVSYECCSLVDELVEI